MIDPTDLPVLRRLAAELAARPALAALDGGPLGTFAVYAPGGTVPGLRLRPDGRLDVQAVLAHGHTVSDALAAVDDVLGASAGDLHVADVELEPAQPDRPSP